MRQVTVFANDRHWVAWAGAKKDDTAVSPVVCAARVKPLFGRKTGRCNTADAMKRLKTGAAGAERKSAPSRPKSPSKEPAPRARAMAKGAESAADTGSETFTVSHGIAEESERQFLTELAAHWRRHGKAALDAALAKDPVRYMNLAAQFMAGPGERKRGERPDELIALLAGLDQKD